MRRKGLWHNLRYRYVYQGEEDRDGQVYKKYKRVSRFPHLGKYLLRLAVILILVGIVAMVTARISTVQVNKKTFNFK